MSKGEKRVVRITKNTLKTILALFLILYIAIPAVATKTSLDLGVAGVGARPLGMGKAHVAIADDANAVFVNPAGLGTQKGWSVTSMSTKLLNRVDYKLLGATYNSKIGTIGIGYIGMSTPAGYSTTTKASLTGASAMSYGASQIVVSFAKNLGEAIKGSSGLGNLSIGASLKMLSNSFTGYDASGSGQAFDVGIMMRPRENVSFGINVQNLGSTVKWGNGSSEQVESKTKIGGAIKLAENKLLVALDADMSMKENIPLLFHGGLEWKPMSLLALRAGIDQSAFNTSSVVSNITLGAGLKVAGVSFDYAYHQDANLGSNSCHYISLSIKPDFLSGLQSTSVFQQISAPIKQVAPVEKAPGNKASVEKKADILSFYE